MLKVISRKLVRKTLEMLKKMADEEGKDESDEYDDDEEGSNEDEVKNEEEDKQKNEDNKEEEEKKAQERRDRYKTFWKEFGKNVKLGIIEDSTNRDKLSKLTRWYSSFNSTELTSFDKYIERAKEG